MDGTEILSLQQARSAIKLLKLEVKQKDEMIVELKSVIDDLTKTLNEIQLKSKNDENSIPQNSIPKTNSNVPNQQIPSNDHESIILTQKTQQNHPTAQSNIPSQSPKKSKTEQPSHFSLLAQKSVKEVSTDQNSTNIKPEIVDSTPHLNLPKPLKSKKDFPTLKSKKGIPTLKSKKDIPTLKSKKDIPLQKKRRGRWHQQKHSFMECKECKEMKPIYCKAMCKQCYCRIKNSKRNKTLGQCEKCDELKQLFSGQTCSSCYVSKKVGECKQCKNVKPIVIQNLCQTCYMKNKPKRECKACRDVEVIYALNMCHKCYILNKPEKVCNMCKKVRQMKAKNMCQTCYARSQKNRKSLNENKMELESANNTLNSLVKLANFFNAN